jgi:peptide chain release factor 1
MNLIEKLEGLLSNYKNQLEQTNESDYKTYGKLSSQISNIEECLSLIYNIKDLKGLSEDYAELVKDLLEENKNLLLEILPFEEEERDSAIIEIRAGTGGDEAALFAFDLLRMYLRYVEIHNTLNPKNKWQIAIMEKDSGVIGGLKSAIIKISGKRIYNILCNESGVHRVQRVPETEANGRLHTSTATVLVLPEADEVEVFIDEKDLRFDYYRASGAGGQHVNKTESAVRITHLPTNTVVQCQDERSQHENRDKAMKVLRARLYDKMLQEQNKARGEERYKYVGDADRSAKFRTYNYPQNRITDHRNNITVYQLSEIMEGNLDLILNKIQTTDIIENL